MRLKMRVLSAIAIAVLLWAGIASAQVQPVDCQTELIACTHNGEVVAVRDPNAPVEASPETQPDNQPVPATSSNRGSAFAWLRYLIALLRWVVGR